MTDGPSPMGVSATTFRWQVEYLSRHFSIISFADLLRGATRGEWPGVGSPTAMITFDDGYRDNVTIAAPILQDVGVTACFFLTTGYIGTDRRFAWDHGTNRDAPVMSWDDVRELRRRGFEIGSHTVTHRRLSDLAEDEFVAELAESRDTLQTEIGEAVRVLAYPFGRFRDYSRSRHQIVAGFYDAAGTSIRGLNVPGRLALLELRRTSVSGAWSPTEFLAEAGGVFDFLDEWRLLVWRLRSRVLSGT